MKKWLCSLILATLVFSGVAQAKQWKVVRFGIEGAYPPFSWTEADGSLKGFDVDMANALCQQMQVKCKLVAQDWDGIIPSLPQSPQHPLRRRSTPSPLPAHHLQAPHRLAGGR